MGIFLALGTSDQTGPMVTARLTSVDLPDFGMPDAVPELPASLYGERLARLRELADARGFDRIVVYADREHSANISYLTGFDPRFEEALLIVGPEDDPAVLVGNECVATAEAAPLAMRVRLHQEFSLPNQPQDRSIPLSEVLAEEGVAAGSRVGLIGWKDLGPDRIEVPAFIVEELQPQVGASGEVIGATDLMIDPGSGLRIINEVEQLAAFEFAACQTSDGVRRLLFGLEPGMTEREAVRLLRWDGTPLSCHLMLSAGPRAAHGLLSPGGRVIERGDPFTVAFGIWGALNCRAGFVVGDASELPADIDDYVEKLVRPYFETVVEWYEALHIGQKGAALQEIVDRRLGDPFFGIFLNPGHQIHLDEWVASPVGPGSDVELASGMAMQVDIIPATKTPYFTTNIEDGIALADDGLRQEFALRYPGAWSRIQARRAFMTDVLGIDLDPAVLPFSNIPAYLPPFILNPDRVMTAA